jgi:ubiquinone/menaquinone biosynthesis C-methylase UbiE
VKTTIRSWTRDRPVNSPFALPRGILGRLAGQIMLRTNTQRELLDPLAARSGSRVLEVGYGPGALIQLLLNHSPASQICGVDPSPDMLRFASRRNHKAIVTGRLDLRLGTAEETGFSDQSFDHVVSANNVAIWPDLHAGLRELHRVLRPEGTLLIAWHSKNAPSPIARANGLPEDTLDQIRRGLDELFSTVTRHDLTHVVAFVAVR